MSTQPVVFLLGPTASGKTGIGLLLNQRIRCRLISVDSSLVYRRMNIGTAKPTPQELLTAPHELIDICEPWDTYSAARFVDDATEQIRQARELGQVPILLGGTMLYFQALEKGLARMPAADPAIRAALVRRATEYGWDVLHQELCQVDPKAGARIHPNDPQRIQRALEVWEITGRPISDFQTNTGISVSKKQDHQPCDTQGINLSPLIKVALFPEDRSRLHSRIAIRFEQMIADGFLEEVRNLLNDSRISAETTSMRSVGYRQAIEYLSGDVTRDQFADKAIIATRQLAKRQLTWIRGMDGMTRFDSLEETPETITDRILSMISATSAD